MGHLSETTDIQVKLLASFALVLTFSLRTLSLTADAVAPCGSSLTPAEAFERATAVFTGRVVSIERLYTPRTRAGSTTPYHEVKLEVEKSWKLVDRRQITLTIPNIYRNTCGSFDVGEEYLVYADRLNDTFFVSPLSRTNRLVDAAEDLKVLGEARIRLRPGEFQTYRILLYGSIVSILLLLAAGLILYRLSRRPFRS